MTWLVATAVVSVMLLQSALSRPRPRRIAHHFTGKGGVGKTTRSELAYSLGCCSR